MEKIQNNVISFPLEKEDIMRLKPDDICGIVWKVSRYGNASDTTITHDTVKLKLLKKEKKQTLPKIKNTPRELKNIAPKILEKIDDYIEDTAEKLWNILKEVFKRKK